MLIAFSGIDGAGKTTQIANLIRYFQSKGLNAVRLWSRGGYTPLFEFIKKTIRFFLGKKLPPPGKTPERDSMLKSGNVSILWLICAIIDLIFYYAVYMRFLIVFHKKVIIADRYIADTFIDFRINFRHTAFYKWWLWKVLLFLAPRPDLEFLLFIPMHEVKKRALEKKEPFEDSEENRKKRFSYYSKLRITSWKKINCLESVEDVTSGMINSIELLQGTMEHHGK